MKAMGWIGIILITFWSATALAQEYKIGTEDLLSITFWQQPDLNSNVRVSQNGTIILPVIGSITAAGLTPTDLANKIVSKISLFNRSISQASVIVTEYGSKKVYVTGYVLQPGKYAFEVIPDIWKIILEAGGPAQNARLSKVKIIRSPSSAKKAVTVDLTTYLQNGDPSALPPIYPGDTIHVPGVVAEGSGTGAGNTSVADAIEDGESSFYIYGQVVRPGGYPCNKKLNILEAIILAGGPTPAAKLDEVKVIYKGDSSGNLRTSVATIDLEKYTRNGVPTPLALNPGDTIYIPEKKNSFFSNIFQHGGIFNDILRVAITAATSMLIFNLAR
ncbi:polysaccharide biosynthesis/export family protein [candidate division KSB1 bacterium]|nr:polysaccharide biosynthesis/export family protein [candidate division KSB1 bacterium]